MFSGPTAKVTVRDSVAAFNSDTGLLAEGGSAAELNIESCEVSNNGTGIASPGAGALVRVSNTTVTDNAVGINCLLGSSLLTRGNNIVEGNSSSDGASRAPTRPSSRHEKVWSHPGAEP